MKPTARQRLGKYVLLGRLGHGGMGKIYLAYTPGPGGIEKLLVIKRLHTHLAGDPELVNNFLDEARLSMALSHPNIVHTYDVGEVDGRYFIVMEHINGQNLGVLLRIAKRSGEYPDSTLWAGLFLGVLDALHAAHTAKDARGRDLHIIHRDISPQNVLVSYDGAPKLVDFGIAKAAMRVSETDAGVLKGKYAYMSPEQCQSEPLDPRSDVFSAGIVLWEMLAGRRLYKADSVLKSVERILAEPPVPPVEANPDCDPALSSVVLKALAKRPQERFASAEDFRDALDEAMRRGRRFRAAETRELMHRLFHDVRERQQRVLDDCLAGLAGTDDDDALRGGASDSDSHPRLALAGHEPESDVHIPDLGVVPEQDGTTPSSGRRSPLVTQEGEVWQKPLLPAPPGAPAPSALTDPGRPAVTAADAKEGGPPRPTSSGKRVAAGILGGLGILMLLGGGYALLAPERRPRVEVPPAGHDTTAGPQDSVRPPSSQPEPGAEVPVADVAASPPVPEPLVEDDPPPPPPEEAPPAAPNMEGATEAAPVDEAPRAASGRPRAGRVNKDAQQPPLAPEPPRTPEVRPEVAEQATAKLTLDTVPWTTVYLGKKKLGDTPLVDVVIPAGEVELLLVNPEFDIRQPYFVKAKAGSRMRKKLKLD
ncbi:MAG: protein kinase domain-containing protein [Myxococcota bacterium]